MFLYKTEVKPAAITDLEVSCRFTKAWMLPAGANLLAEQRSNLDNGAVTVYPSFSPFGINGGYYYARLGFKF